MPKLADLAESRRNLLMIDPRILAFEEGYNIRDMETPAAKAALAELADSIAESGIRVPLAVRLVGETVYVAQGHRRLAAVRALIERGLPIETVPCVGEPRGERNDAERTLDLLLSNDGFPLTEMEKAEGVRRLVNFGWDDKKIAAKIGKGVGYVGHLKSLLAMPERVQEMVRNDLVAAATALHTVRSEGDAAVEVLSEAIAEAAAEAPQAPLASKSSETIVPPPKAPKATPKRIEKAAEKVAAKQGRERPAKKTRAAPELKPLKAPSMGKAHTEVLLSQVGKLLTKIQNGTYDDEEHEVPPRLVSEARDVADAIVVWRQGFRSEAAE